jgi:hypothetical protein
MATTNHFRVSVAVLALTLAAAVLILPDSAASAQTSPTVTLDANTLSDGAASAQTDGAASAQTSPSGTLDANTLPLECVSAQSCTALVLADVQANAQTFTAINSGNVTSAQVQVEDWRDSGEEVIVQLATVDSFGAIGPIIPGASATIPGSEIPTFFDEKRLLTVSFDNPPAVQAGQKYALVLSTPAPFFNYAWVFAEQDFSGPDEYPQGEAFYNQGDGWVKLGTTSQDMVFAIYVTTVSDQISDLKELVTSLPGLPAGTNTSLQAKLNDALSAANGGDTASACTALNDFISQVRAQAGKKKISAQDAEELIAEAQRIQEVLGC